MGSVISSLVGYDSKLHIAALIGDPEALRNIETRSGEYLVFHSLSTHIDAKTSDGTSSLMICAAFDHIDAAKVLLEKGATVNLQDRFGSHSLTIAASAGHSNFIRLLLEQNGINVNMVNMLDANALCSAAFCGQLECVKILLNDKRCSTASTLQSKSSALHAAAYTGRLEIVKLLLSHGMKDSKDANNLTACALAEMKNHEDIAALLRENEKPTTPIESHTTTDILDELDHSLDEIDSPVSGMLGDMRRPLKQGQWHDSRAGKA